MPNLNRYLLRQDQQKHRSFM